MSDPDPEGMGALAAKIAKVMGAIEHVPKNGYNNYHKYEYSSDDDVMQSLRPEMAEHNLAVFHSVTDREATQVETSNGTAWKTVITMEITIVDGDSGQSYTSTWMGEADDSQDKGLYKAFTSGIKYWALKSFLLSADSDVETHDEEASQGKQEGPSNGAPQEPTDGQLNYAKDLARKDVWTDNERSQLLNERIPECSKSDLSDLIDHMKNVVENGREVLNGG
jgi:hypothetical protein